MNFDLTTQEGRNAALKTFDKCGRAIAPQWWIAKKVASKVYDFFASTDVIEAQQKAAVELIKAGKQNNVDKMNITLDQKAGVDLSATIEGVPVKCMVGKNGKMTIQVSYKN
jgi:hypothetical protein